MLEDNLDLMSSKGRRIASPASLDELSRNYFRVSSLTVRPPLGKAYEYTGRVITLKPSVALPHIATRVKEHTVKGYFAWGEGASEFVSFNIYSPTSKNTKQLDTLLALFSYALNRRGCAIPAYAGELNGQAHIR